MENNSESFGMSKEKQLTLQEIQHELLLMMKDFDNFCREHNITYYLSHGTLIGAVRHKGFIPWDDDIDVLVPRCDYEKLIKYNSINDRYDIVSFFNHGKYYHPYLYCNIADKNTIMVEHLSNTPTGKGLFIDVFALDKCPDNPLIRKIFLLRIKVLRTLIHQHARAYFPISLKGIARNIVIFGSSLFKNQSKLVKHTEKIITKYENKNTKYCGHFVLNNQKINIWPSSCFANAIDCDFEGYKFLIPNDYDTVLRLTYGDYMKLPPEEDRIPRHDNVEVYRR